VERRLREMLPTFQRAIHVQPVLLLSGLHVQCVQLARWAGLEK
jgi:hypothetical protein